jgi:hypothetical protein
VLTVGPAGIDGLFPVLELTVFNGAGTCLSCRWQGLDLSNLFIGQGTTDLELSGFLTPRAWRCWAPHSAALGSASCVGDEAAFDLAPGIRPSIHISAVPVGTGRPQCAWGEAFQRTRIP